MKYFVCTYGKGDSFEGVAEIFEKSIRSNCYKIHKFAKHPSAVYEINKGDVVLLSFNQSLVAWGTAISKVQMNDNEDWHLSVVVDKWRLYDSTNHYAGVSSYGISWATIIGGSMSTVRMVEANWSVEKIQCMGTIKELPIMDHPVLELPLKDIASWHYPQSYYSESGIVIAMNSPKEIVEEAPLSNGQSTIEHLFTRINRQGTRLDGEELVYSTIKSYWPEIEDVVNRCAKGRMVCSRMLSLALRLYFTDHSSDHWSGPVGVNRIKGMSESMKRDVKDFLEKDMEKLLRTVDEWLVYKNGEGFPKVLKTAIAQKTPDLYLLLLTMAMHNVDIERKSVIALTLLLYFYDFKIRRSRRVDASKYIIEELYRNGFTEDTLRKAVAYAMTGEGIDRWLIGVFDLRKVLNELKSNQCCISAFAEDTPWIETLNRFIGNRDLLLFAQAEYLEETFSDYDPARKDLWAEYNRPWDYDHILPQSVVNKWEHDTADNQTWLWCIGNFAAIPLEENRSKNNRDDWQYYSARKHRWPDVFDVDQIAYSYKEDNEDDGGVGFRMAVCERFVRLYAKLYEAVEPILPNV